MLSGYLPQNKWPHANLSYTNLPYRANYPMPTCPTWHTALGRFASSHFYSILWCSNWGPASTNVDRLNWFLDNLIENDISWASWATHKAPLKQNETMLSSHFASQFTILFVNIQHEYFDSNYECSLLTYTISQKSKQQKLLSTGDVLIVHTNATTVVTAMMNWYQPKMSTATILDLKKLRQTRSCIRWKKATHQIVPINKCIIATCLQEVTDEKAVQSMFLAQSCRNKLNRQRQNLVPSLPIIKDRPFLIPTEYTDFCLFDSE